MTDPRLMLKADLITGLLVVNALLLAVVAVAIQLVVGVFGALIVALAAVVGLVPCLRTVCDRAESVAR